MNLIVSELCDAFKDAGASEDKAGSAAVAVPVAERLVTRKEERIWKSCKTLSWTGSAGSMTGS